MTTISHGALRLFFASSAVMVNLLSKFEPALGHVDNRNLIRNEDKKQHRFEETHDVLFPNRPKQERKRVTSVVVDETSHPVSGRLQNSNPQGHQKTNSTENIVLTECDPDVGILACGDGQHCMRRPTTNGGESGGVCVPTSNVPPFEDDEMKANEIGSTLEQYAVPQSHLLHKRKQRNLQVSCGLLEVPVDIYIGADAYSNGNVVVDGVGTVVNENFWGVESELSGTIVPYTSFPYENPVDGTYCIPLLEVITLFIYDTENDGIDAEDNIAGLALNINGVADIIIFEVPGFFTLGLVIACFECSDYDTCAVVVCPTDAPSSSPTTAAPNTSSSAAPSPELSAAPTRVPTISSAPSTLRASKSSKKSGNTPGSSGKGKGKGNKKGSNSSDEDPSGGKGSGKGTKVDHLFLNSRR